MGRLDARSRARMALRRRFAALAVPNYRRYFLGQLVSVSGSWMGGIAQGWLVFALTRSGLAVGATAALYALPMLVGGAWGGLLADRFSTRPLLIVTQALLIVPQIGLWALLASGVIRLDHPDPHRDWMIYGLVLLAGVINTVDLPARESFASELVDRARVVNAVALKDFVSRAGWIVGSTAAGAVILWFGVAQCFALDAVSYAVMLLALARLDPAALRAAPPVSHSRGQLRGALGHVRATPALWLPLASMVVVGVGSLGFDVLAPLLAHDLWHGTASTSAWLVTATGFGSLVGALAAGGYQRITARTMIAAAAGAGVLELFAAAAPSLALQLAALSGFAALSVIFLTGANAQLQLAAPPAMRGRVMALYGIAWLASGRIGGGLLAWLADAWSGRGALFAAGATALLAAGTIHLASRSARRSLAASHANDPPHPARSHRARRRVRRRSRDSPEQRS